MPQSDNDAERITSLRSFTFPFNSTGGFLFLFFPDKVGSSSGMISISISRSMNDGGKSIHSCEVYTFLIILFISMVLASIDTCVNCVGYDIAYNPDFSISQSLFQW